MSRRKKKPRRQDAPPSAELPDPPPHQRKPLNPNPPRPSKALLLFACLLLAAWIAFLIVLAVNTTG